MKSTLIEDDIDIIIVVVEDASEDILQCYGAKQETLHERIEKEIKERQKAIHLRHKVPTVPSSLKIVELGDETTILRRLADAIETWLQQVQEEKEQATKSLKQEKEEVMEQK
jgi:hypothetical protein